VAVNLSRLAVGSAATGLVVFLVALGEVVADGRPSLRTVLLLLAGLALVAVYVVAHSGELAAIRRGRRPRLTSLGVLATAAVVGALVAADLPASRAIAAADLTRHSLYTLSDRSAQVTRSLNDDLTITAFFRSDQRQARAGVETLLDLYRQQSRRVHVRYADFERDAALAGRLGVDVPGSIALQYRSRPAVVLDPAQQSESDVTTAIQRLRSTRTLTLCWAAGDGERDLKDTNEVSGYSAVAELLRTTNYRVQEIPLAQQGVPTACDALVVLQLGRPLADPSVLAVRDYLARGGKLLLAIDPWLDQRTVASANAVLAPYGSAFDGGLVVEPEPARAATGDPTIPVVSSYGASPVTGNLDRRYVFLPQATPITGAAPAGVTAVDLAITTDRAYSIPQQRTDLEYRPTDRGGPFVLLRSIEQPRAGPPTRIVVGGTSALAENRTMPPSANGSNPDLLLASLDWLTEQDDLVSIPPKPAAAGPLALGDAGVRWNIVLTVLLLPLLLAGAGVAIRVRLSRSA
jgi:ABC-type uncharacterized transport system